MRLTTILCMDGIPAASGRFIDGLGVSAADCPAQRRPGTAAGRSNWLRVSVAAVRSPRCSMKGDVKRKSFSSELDQAKFAWHPAPPSMRSQIRCEGSHVCVAGGWFPIPAFPRMRSVIQNGREPSRARRSARHGEPLTAPGRSERIEEEGKQMLDSEVDF
jgi:hypothetical protein